MSDYRKRIADSLIAEKLSYMGAVLVQGPKWCGKTTTSEQIAKSVLYMADPESLTANVELASIRPSSLLQGSNPRLIDEWQVAPCLWDAVRFSVDHGSRGMYILTGSAVPPEVDNADDKRSKIMHTGTGRIGRVMMRTMSLWESGESTGEVSLSDLFAGIDVSGARAYAKLEGIVEFMCRGGWPASIDLKGRMSRGPVKEYCEAVAESDVSRVDGTVRDPGRVRRLMRSLARLQGTQAAASVLRTDMVANDSESMDDDTVYSYLRALKSIFVTEDLSAWCPNLRCKTPVRTTDTRYFVDPSIATAMLGATPGALMGDTATCGILFETMAVRDLRCYAEALGGSIHHYLDKSGLECDAIICRDDGSYGLVEIKLGGDVLIEQGATNLNILANKLDIGKMAPPSFRMVLVADGGFAYRRKEDDILVCPISCLRP